jgi:cytochrome c553
MKSSAWVFALGLASLVAACTTATLEEDSADTQSNIGRTPDQPEIAPPDEKSVLDLKGYASPVKRAADGKPELAAGVIPFTPRWELWSDGAKKRRFIQLPKGEKITVDEKGEFTFPVGTVIYKEFYKGDKLHETRVIKHEKDGYRIATYLWNADLTDAKLDAEGGTFGEGATKHDIPDQVTCASCHNNEANPVLGLSYVQLNPAMSAEDKSALFKSAPAAFAWPEAATEPMQTALGYTHANCGHCHQDTEPGGFSLRLLPSDTKSKDLASIAAFASTRTKGTRMLSRMKSGNMPMLGVSVVDDKVTGEGAVAAGIREIIATK